MALALNKILLANAVDNTAGAYFQNQVVNVAANSSTVLLAFTTSSRLSTFMFKCKLPLIPGQTSLPLTLVACSCRMV